MNTNTVEVHSVDHACDWKATQAYTGELTMTGCRIARAALRYCKPVKLKVRRGAFERHF